MRINQRSARVLAAAVIASLLAACGGGGHGTSSFVPTGPTNSGPKSTPSASTNFKATIPLPSSATSSGKKGPQFISAQGTSSLVVSVVPTDPAEAAQWATLYGASGFTVCYNIFNNGAPVTTNPAVVVTVTGSTASITFPFPSPPGQDTFTITQYAGACSSTNPYAPPTPPPGLTTTQQIMSQSPPLVVNIVAGANNNFNVQLSACNTPPGPGPISQPSPVTCAVPNPPGTTTITPTLGSTVAFAYMAQSTPALPITLPAAVPLPISGPMREQGAFVAAGSRVGLPIPIIGLDGTGNAIPYTAPIAPNTTPSSGTFPKAGDGLSITHTESGTGTHFTLYLVDATTGAIAQNAEPITLTQLNALNAADAKVGGTVGDPYVLVAAFDGTSSAVSTSLTVSMAGKINGAAITTQTLTIKPQASLFTAVAAGPATGYTDAAAPYATAADILNTTGATGVAAAGQGYWVTDGGKIHLVGTSTTTVTGATTLTGMTLDNNANLTAGQILAVDNSTAANAGSATPVAAGIYAINPATPATNNPLAVQNLTTGNYVAFGKPQAIAFVPGGYVYVAAGNKIYAVDPQANGAGGFAQITAGAVTYDIAEEIGALPVSGLSGGTASGFDMIASGTKLIFADPGNNRIVSIDTATCVVGGAACTPTVIASGHPFVGLAVNGTGYVATDTAGQIYTITSTGTVTSLGLSNAAAPKDGVVGVIGTSPLAPAPYTPQGQTANFFGSASTPSLPYNIAPFTAAGPVFAPAAQTAIANVAGTLKFAADTANGNFGSTAGATTSGFGIAFISAAGANAALTSNSYLFTDKGLLRTLVP